MTDRNTIAAKFDIIEKTNGQQVVIDIAMPYAGQPEWDGMYGGLSMEDGHEMLVYGCEIKRVVSRHPDNAELDREYSELAQCKNHAFGQQRLEFA